MAQNQEKPDMNQAEDPEEQKLNPWLEKRLLNKGVALVHPVLPAQIIPHILPAAGNKAIGENGSRLTRQIVNRPTPVTHSPENLSLLTLTETSETGRYQPSSEWPALQLLVSNREADQVAPAEPAAPSFHRAPDIRPGVKDHRPALSPESTKPRPPAAPTRPATPAPVMVRGKIEESAVFPSGKPKDNSRISAVKPTSPPVDIAASRRETTQAVKPDTNNRRMVSGIQPEVTPPSSRDSSQNQAGNQRTAEKTTTNQQAARSPSTTPKKSTGNRSDITNAAENNHNHHIQRTTTNTTREKKTTHTNRSKSGKAANSRPDDNIQPAVNKISRKTSAPHQTGDAVKKPVRTDKSSSRTHAQDIHPVSPSAKAAHVPTGTGTQGNIEVTALQSPIEPQVTSLPENIRAVQSPSSFSNQGDSSPVNTLTSPSHHTKASGADSNTGKTRDAVPVRPPPVTASDNGNEGTGQSALPLPVRQVPLPESTSRIDSSPEIKHTGNKSRGAPASRFGLDSPDVQAVRSISPTPDTAVHRSITPETPAGNEHPVRLDHTVHLNPPLRPNTQVRSNPPVYVDQVKSPSSDANIKADRVNEAPDNRRSDNRQLEISNNVMPGPLSRRIEENEHRSHSPASSEISSRQFNLPVQRAHQPVNPPSEEAAIKSTVRIPATGTPAALNLPVARTTRPGSLEESPHQDSLFRQTRGNPPSLPVITHHLPGMAASPAAVSRVPQQVASTATSPAVSVPSSTAASSHSSAASSESATAANSPSPTNQQNEQNNAPDLKALARELYPMLRRMLIIEKERLPHF
jgi:hypothetical protein